VAADSLGRVDTNTVAVHLPPSVAFGYDLNGNLRTNGARVLEYDDENQLIRVTEPGAWKSEFVYDGRMRRRVGKEFKWQSSAWVQTAEVRYLYDGNLVLQERNAMNLPQATYTRGMDLSAGQAGLIGSLEGAGGIGGLLARTDNQLMVMGDVAAHAYYHADGNGNVTMLVDVRQRPAARYLYDPFGNTLTASGPLAEANLYRFSSKELHAASGLVYYGYRFYDPALQRWPNQDPFGEAGGVNLYAFVGNNSINKFDPLGLEPSWEELNSLDVARQRAQHQLSAARSELVNLQRILARLQAQGLPEARQCAYSGSLQYNLSQALRMADLLKGIQELRSQIPQLSQAAVSAAGAYRLALAGTSFIGTTLGSSAGTVIFGGAGAGAAAVGGTGVVVAAVGGYGIGYGIGTINVGGQSIHESIANGLYNLCPGCFD